MSDNSGFDMDGLAGKLMVAVILIAAFIVLAPILFRVVLELAPAVAILTLIFWILRGLVKKFVG